MMTLMAQQYVCFVSMHPGFQLQHDNGSVANETRLTVKALLLLLLLQVADQVMWQAASFPNAVEPLAEVLKLPNPLTMDVLTYMVGSNKF
jgi:hypothetical protein